MASGEVHWDEAAVADFTHDASEEAIKIITERVAEEGRVIMPVLDLAFTRPPGENWSMPPGSLARSVHTVYGEGIDGPYGEVRADAVYRFSRKRRHKIRPALLDALTMQQGRPVP